MGNISIEDFKAQLERDVPGALVSVQHVPHSPNGKDETTTPAKAKGEKESVNLLETDDPVILAERVPDVLRYMRDTLGYEFLSNLTPVDYLADNVIEIVYHLMHLDGGPPLVIKTRVPRDHAVVPSITPFWPGADLQEREAYDLFGVDFPGHPFLTRIYMWDEFEGYPMRKDFPKQGDKYFDDDDD